MRRSTTDRSEKTRLTNEILREHMLSRIAWWSELEQVAATGDYTAVQYIKRRSSPKPDYSVLIRSTGSKRGAAELVRKHLEEVFCKPIPPDEEADIMTSLASMSSCLREQDYVPFTNEEVLTVIANCEQTSMPLTIMRYRYMSLRHVHLCHGTALFCRLISTILFS